MCTQPLLVYYRLCLPDLFGTGEEGDDATNHGQHKKCTGVELMSSHRHDTMVTITHKVVDTWNQVVDTQNDTENSGYNSTVK